MQLVIEILPKKLWLKSLGQDPGNHLMDWETQRGHTEREEKQGDLGKLGFPLSFLFIYLFVRKCDYILYDRHSHSGDMESS
jgi:hypothetical protein